MQKFRPFALEEAYVTIFEEYSPFFLAPVKPGSRVETSGGWQLEYDLAGRENLELMNAAQLPDRGKKKLAVWSDIYMSDLKFDKQPVSQNHLPTGMPGEYVETVGSNGRLGFNAAVYGHALSQMQGYRRFWRVFVDVKKGKGAAIEKTWEFQGAYVDGDSYSGSPIAVVRSFGVRYFPECDAMYTLPVSYQAGARAHKAQSPYVEQIPTLAVIELLNSRYANTSPGTYTLTAIKQGNGLYTFQYGTNEEPGEIVNQPWVVGRDYIVDGRAAGRLRFRLTGSAPSGNANSEIIVVNK